jgi:hypothetical protein
MTSPEETEMACSVVKYSSEGSACLVRLLPHRALALRRFNRESLLLLVMDPNVTHWVRFVKKIHIGIAERRWDVRLDSQNVEGYAVELSSRLGPEENAGGDCSKGGPQRGSGL